MTLSAEDLIKKYLKDANNRLHSRESEIVLRAIAKELNEDQEVWGTAGLLHDLDWEETADNFPKHGIRTMEILAEEGFDLPETAKHAISAHNEKHTGVKRETPFDFALAAGESVTGLIYAYALMRPEKLENMKSSSLNKKFKSKSFAENVSREFISDIEKVGIEKSRFFELAIKAMQSIAGEIGL